MFLPLDYDQKIKKIKKLLVYSKDKITFAYGMHEYIDHHEPSEAFLDRLYTTLVTIWFNAKIIQENMWHELTKKRVKKIMMAQKLDQKDADNILSNL